MEQEKREEAQSILAERCSPALAFVTARTCPRCSAPVRDGDDLCEHCSEWLRAGECVFCYSPVAVGQRYCGRCGNPPLGVTCGACGAASRFDFCPGCGAGLTEQAAETLKQLEQDAEVLAFLEQGDTTLTEAIDRSASVSAAEVERSTSEGEEALQPSVLAQVPPQVVPTVVPEAVLELQEARHQDEAKGSRGFPPSLTPSQERAKAESRAHSATRTSAATVLGALSRQQLAANKRLAREALLRTREEALKNRTFETHQDARRFAGALCILVGRRTELLRVAGWRCNAYGNLHPDGPSGCAGPSSGGVWVTERTVLDEREEMRFD